MQPHAQHEQREPEESADRIRLTPRDELAHERGSHGAQGAERGDERGRRAAFAAIDHLAHERESRPEFTRQAEARDETPDRVGRNRGDDRVGEIGDAVQHDRSVQRRAPPTPVAEPAPDEPADHETQQLRVLQQRAHLDRVASRPQVAYARHPHHGEEQQVEDVDEIAQRDEQERPADAAQRMELGGRDWLRHEMYGTTTQHGGGQPCKLMVKPGRNSAATRRATSGGVRGKRLIMYLRQG